MSGWKKRGGEGARGRLNLEMTSAGHLALGSSGRRLLTTDPTGYHEERGGRERDGRSHARATRMMMMMLPTHTHTHTFSEHPFQRLHETDRTFLLTPIFGILCSTPLFSTPARSCHASSPPPLIVETS